MAQTHLGPPPDFDLKVDPSLSSYGIPAKEWLKVHDKHWNGLATSSVVFNEEGRVLLVQRASHDSMPNRWEIPGGAADDEDRNLLYSAARELWEESGLTAKHFTHIITRGPGIEPGYVYTNRTGRRIFCCFTFHVEVKSCDKVVLDPNEHQDFIWATEDEIKMQKTGERQLPITTPLVHQIILEAFRLKEERK